MVNRARFNKDVSKLLTPQFYKMMGRVQNTRPEGLRIPKAALIPPKDRLPDSELPFAQGDRVQITKGEHKGIVGTVIMRYPGFGNAFLVMGAGVEADMINIIESRDAEENPEQWEPVTKMYKAFDYKDLRLVSKVQNEDGKDEDVAIHSIKLGAPVYDPVSNSYKRVRHAAHDPSITVPWPLVKAEAVESELTTNSVMAEMRSQYVTSAIESSIPIGAVDQITNIHSKHSKARYARPITQHDLDRVAAPAMPHSAKTREMLAKIAAMPKPERREFDSEIEAFISEKIQQGLQRRHEQEQQIRSQF